MKSLISSSRYLILIPVLGSFLSAILLLVYGMVEIVQIIRAALSAEVTVKAAKTLALDLIVIVDVFLLGTVLYITALGLYAVSYTHLDVYKRQRVYKAAVSPCSIAAWIRSLLPCASCVSYQCIALRCKE